MEQVDYLDTGSKRPVRPVPAFDLAGCSDIHLGTSGQFPT